MSDVVRVRRNGEEITVSGVGAVATRIHASQRQAEAAFDAWMRSGQLALVGWSGPLAKRFVQAHSAGAAAWLALIDALARNAAACETLEGGASRSAGGSCPAPLVAPGGDAMFSAEPDRLRRFTTVALDVDPRSLIGSCTYEGLSATVVPLAPDPIASHSLVVAEQWVRPPATPVPVSSVLTLEPPRAEAVRCADAIAQAAAFTALVADGVESADGGFLMSLLQLTPAANIWAERLKAGKTVTPVEMRVAAGKRLHAALVAACDAEDADRVKLLYGQVQRRSGEYAFMAGFMANIDDVESFDAMVKDRMEPRGDWVSEFKKGVAESIVGTAKFVFSLSEWQLIDDPSKYIQTRIDLVRTGALLLSGKPEVAKLLGLDGPEAARERRELYRAMVDADTWKTNPARALGHLAPDVGALVLTRGLALEAAASRHGLNTAARLRNAQVVERWAVEATRVEEMATLRRSGVTEIRRYERVFDYLARGEIPKFTGRRLPNSKYAGGTYEGPAWTPKLAAKYPDGVKITERGTVNFTPYAKKIVRADRLLTGDVDTDIAILGLKRERGYIWHHVEDGVTFELVPEDLHTAVSHVGGAAVTGRAAKNMMWFMSGGVR